MGDLSNSSNHYPGINVLEALDVAENYNEAILKMLRAEISAIREIDTQNRVIRILDFGAGNGRFIKEMTDPGSFLLAVEPDQDLAKLVEGLEGVQLVTLDSVPPSSIDFLFSLNVLEHIEKDVDLLKQLFEKVVPGGRVFVFVPAWPHLFSEFDSTIGHYRRYTRYELRDKVGRAGFLIGRIRYFDPLGYFAALIFKLLSNKPLLSRGSVSFFDRFVFPISLILMPLTSNFFGKNLVLTARRQSAGQGDDKR